MNILQILKRLTILLIVITLSTGIPYAVGRIAVGRDWELPILWVMGLLLIVCGACALFVLFIAIRWIITGKGIDIPEPR